MRVLEPLWRFLAVCEEPALADVIFVFGSRALEVPRRAADLYAAGFSRRILVSGRFGPMTEGVFGKPEALVFKDELMRRGVPEGAIRTEVEENFVVQQQTVDLIQGRCLGTIDLQLPRAKPRLLGLLQNRGELIQGDRIVPAPQPLGCEREGEPTGEDSIFPQVNYRA